MNWLARLKKSAICAETDPTKPTKPGFVGFVAPILALVEKTGGDAPAAKDPAPTQAPDRLRAASLALDAVIVAADMAANPDRWSYPHSAAMNTAEIDRFTARLARFTDKGLIQGDAESLADRLVIRDREHDDRAMCLECAHLHRAGRCGNWQRAGVAIQSRDAFMPVEMVRQLQRCDGFTGALPAAVSGNQGVTHE